MHYTGRSIASRQKLAIGYHHTVHTCRQEGLRLAASSTIKSRSLPTPSSRIKTNLSQQLAKSQRWNIAVSVSPASRLVLTMPVWSADTRRAPSGHCTATHEMSTPHPPLPPHPRPPPACFDAEDSLSHRLDRSSELSPGIKNSEFLQTQSEVVTSHARPFGGEPGVLKRFGRRHSLLWIHPQQFSDDVLLVIGPDRNENVDKRRGGGGGGDEAVQGVTLAIYVQP